jgi:hypothetical protein
LPHVDALVCRRETFNFADRLFGAKSGLSDDTSGLTDLSANLLDRGRQLFGGAGASAGIRCTLVMDCAVSRIADALPVIARITSPIAPRNASTELSICSARCSRALESSRTGELRLRLRAIAPWKTRIARARRGMLSHHPARVAVAAAWRGCHNVEEFMAQRRPACLTWILPDAAEETR